MNHRSAFAGVALALTSATCMFTSASAGAPRPVVIPKGWPQVVMIPRIRVRAPVESVALNTAAQLKAPYHWNDVAWYDRGPKPGEAGRANVFGHLDSLCCPAAFYRLRELHKGDVVQVSYKSGTVLNFIVQWQNVYWNNQLPLKYMFANTKERGIILMTCTGVFHRDGTGYDHKRLVYATLKT